MTITSASLDLPVERMRTVALTVNRALKEWLATFEMWDFCIIFGVTDDGELSVISEISQDCMRLRHRYRRATLTGSPLARLRMLFAGFAVSYLPLMLAPSALAQDPRASTGKVGSVMRSGGRLFVASDLDGTLLTTAGVITERSRLAVEQLRVAGGTFVVVTARPLRDTTETVGDLADLVVCSGGGVVFDPARRRVIRSTTFDAVEATALITLLRRKITGVLLGVDVTDRCDLDEGFDLDQPDASGLRWLRVHRTTETVIKILVQCPGIPADVVSATVERILGPKVCVSVSNTRFVEVLPAAVDKSVAVKAIAAGSPGKVTVAFGDMPNDIPMLRWADVSVAVANAHPSVIAVADHLTYGNDEDGVAVVLERLATGQPIP